MKRDSLARRSWSQPVFDMCKVASRRLESGAATGSQRKPPGDFSVASVGAVPILPVLIDSRMRPGERPNRQHQLLLASCLHQSLRVQAFLLQAKLPLAAVSTSSSFRCAQQRGAVCLAGGTERECTEREPKRNALALEGPGEMSCDLSEQQQSDLHAILALSRQGKCQEAVAYLTTLRTPHVQQFNAALGACEEGCNASAALAVYGIMQQAQIAPDFVTHLPLMRCLLRDRQYAAVLQLFPAHKALCESADFGQKPHIDELSIGYSLAIKAASKQGNWKLVRILLPQYPHAR